MIHYYALLDKTSKVLTIEHSFTQLALREDDSKPVFTMYPYMVPSIHECTLEEDILFRDGKPIEVDPFPALSEVLKMDSVTQYDVCSKVIQWVRTDPTFHILHAGLDLSYKEVHTSELVTDMEANLPDVVHFKTTNHAYVEVTELPTLQQLRTSYSKVTTELAEAEKVLSAFKDDYTVDMSEAVKKLARYFA